MIVEKKFKYIYGPVSSWRLGRSLGIDLISQKIKVCTFNCVYCQIGHAKNFMGKRSIFVPTKEVLKEIGVLEDILIDYITFSGKGEPTLAANLGEVIEGIKKVRSEKIAVITNASLINDPTVQDDLSLADLVMVKMDACSEDLFLSINKPTNKIKFKQMIEGIKEFRAGYRGKFTIQIMFIESNKARAKEFAKICREIGPDEIEINTPLRPSSAKPLPKEELDKILPYFKGLNTVSVYDAKKSTTVPLNKKDTFDRRGE